MSNTSVSFFRLLQISAFAVFLGRAYQHLFWDGPYRELFWDPAYAGWLVEHLTNMKWEEYVTNPAGDIWFKKFVVGQGVFYACCAGATLFIKKLPQWTRWILVLGGVDLILLALIYMKDKFYHFGQFFEYSLQFGAPLFLFYTLDRATISKNFILLMKIATALTFACHGLYALGYYPRPEIFTTMTQNILGLENEGVRWFLLLAGIADWVVAFCLFLPYKKWVISSLWYAVVWGALTSFARIIGNFYVSFPLESIHQWAFETVYRFPHFLLPLALILVLKKKDHLSI